LRILPKYARITFINMATESAQVNLSEMLPAEHLERLNIANRAITDAARMLSVMQNEGGYDRRVAGRLARSYSGVIESLIDGVAVMGLAAALGDIEGTGIMARSLTDWEFGSEEDSRLKNTLRKKPARSRPAPVESDTVGDVQFFRGFKNGKELGYEQELGDKWYLVAGWGGEYYVPVEGLRRAEFALRYVGL
jgi:hypothetical protein